MVAHRKEDFGEAVTSGGSGVTARVLHGDCIAVMRGELADESVDAIVTDPPYGLGFEVVCDACRLARNKHLTECGNCWVGRSVHDRDETQCALF